MQAQQAQRINITLPNDLLKQLQMVVPLGKRSRFIANAVSEKLKRKRNIQKELEKSLKANAEFYQKVSEEWKATEVEGWPE